MKSPYKFADTLIVEYFKIVEVCLEHGPSGEDSIDHVRSAVEQHISIIKAAGLAKLVDLF